MRPAPSSIVLPALLIMAGFAAVYGLSNFIQTKRPQLPETYGDTGLYLNGSQLRGYALGAEGLIADWYYMRSLQYIGDKLIASGREDVDLNDLRFLDPRLLYPYLNNATDLDPHFIAAYTYGAILLPAIDVQQALAIANKGVENNPDSWRLYQYLGYIYWKLENYPEAARSFELGSEVPAAPPFMRLMAGSMATEGGSRATARAVFKQMLADSDDPMVKLTAERRLRSLDSLDEQDAINGSLDQFKARNGRCAYSLSEIIPLLTNVKLPEGRDFSLNNSNHLVDPTGAEYLLDKENCRVKLDPERTGLAL